LFTFQSFFCTLYWIEYLCNFYARK